MGSGNILTWPFPTLIVSQVRTWACLLLKKTVSTLGHRVFVLFCWRKRLTQRFLRFHIMVLEMNLRVLDGLINLSVVYDP